jgi:hypothetical protein
LPKLVTFSSSLREIRTVSSCRDITSVCPVENYRLVIDFKQRTRCHSGDTVDPATVTHMRGKSIVYILSYNNPIINEMLSILTSTDYHAYF